jgi:hypothetical protein
MGGGKMKYTRNPLIEAWVIIPAHTLLEVIRKGYRQTTEDQDAFDSGVDAMFKIAGILVEESK